MITKVFLDLDGVLVDFFSAAIRQHGMSHKWTHANWPAGEWGKELRNLGIEGQKAP